jgi:hypothetical protein
MECAIPVYTSYTGQGEAIMHDDECECTCEPKEPYKPSKEEYHEANKLLDAPSDTPMAARIAIVEAMLFSGLLKKPSRYRRFLSWLGL